MFEKNATKTNDNFHPKNLSFKKILFVTILLIILFSIAGLIIYLRPSFDKEYRISKEKNKILKRLNLYDKDNNPLTAEEKKEIYNKLSDTKIQEYDFSREEKIKMLKALNDK